MMGFYDVIKLLKLEYKYGAMTREGEELRMKRCEELRRLANMEFARLNGTAALEYIDQFEAILKIQERYNEYLREHGN